MRAYSSQFRSQINGNDNSDQLNDDKKTDLSQQQQKQTRTIGTCFPSPSNNENCKILLIL